MTHKVVSVKTYAIVFLALIGLTAATVGISRIDLGEYNFVCAMTIAVMKGSLVVNSSQGGGSKDTWVMEAGK